MRRVDVVLLTLAFVLAASPAAADPVSTLIITAFGVSTGSIAAALIRIGVGLATSALSNALSRKLSGGQPRGPRGFRLQTLTAGDEVPQSFILGRYITAGNLAAPEMSHGLGGDTPFLTRVVDLSDIRVEALESLIIDGVACELATGSPATLQMTAGDGPTPAIHPEYGPTVNKGDFIGVAWCKFYDGTQDAADPMLRSKYGSAAKRPWTADMVGTGVAYAILTFLIRNSPVVWQGRPDVRFVVRGIRLYDPRKDSTAGGSGSHRYTNTGTHEWTDNPVVMIYNVLRGIRVPASQSGDLFGGGFSAADLPYANWSAAMNACDVMIGDRKTYTAGLEVAMGGSDAGGMSPADVIEELLNACAGQITDVGGTLYIRVGPPGLPVKFITDDDILVTEPQDMDPFPGAQDSYNIVHATMMSPERLWSPREMTSRRDDTAIATDGQELPADIQLPAVTSVGQAAQLMRAWLKDAQRHIRQTITLPPDGILVRPLDVISWTSSRNGYVNKLFEVAQVAIDPMSLSTTLALREVDPGDYDWSVGDDLADDAPDVDTLPRGVWRSIAAPGIEISGELRNANQQVVGVMLINCLSDSPYLDRFEVSYRPSKSLMWRSVGASDLDTFEVVGLSDGLYDIRARAISRFGAISQWTQNNNVSLTLFRALPKDVQNFAGNVVGAMLHLTWDAVPDLDLSHYRIRYSSKTSGASYQNATDLVHQVPRPGVAATVPAKTGTYFIKAYDKLGNASAAATSIVVSTNVADLDALNVVATMTEHPNFAGAKTDVIYDSGPDWITIDPDALAAIHPDEPLWWLAGGTAQPTGVWRDDLPEQPVFYPVGGNAVLVSGIYQFQNVIDLGQKYTSRVSIDLEVELIDYTSLFDDWPGLFDDRQGLFDGDVTAIDTTSVRTQVSTTEDNPAGSPTWSAWQDFVVGDLRARAIRFRVILETRNVAHAPAVKALSATVDMPDRMEGERAITFTGTRTVTYPVAFKATPVVAVTITMAAGDRYEISGESRTGFTITVKNSAGNNSTSAATMSYVAKGYGREYT